MMKILFFVLFFVGLVAAQTTKPSTCTSASVNSEGLISIASCGASPSLANNFNSLKWALAVADSFDHIRGVFIPAGQYKMTVTQTITINYGKIIKGTQDFAHGGDVYSLVRGSALLVTPTGTMATTSPLILLHNDAVLDGITVHYVPQNNVNNIIAYPPTISMEQSTQVSNVTLTNAYFGILAAGGTYGSSGDHVIRNVNMTALYRGIVVDNCGSAGRIDNVNINPQYWWWSYHITTDGSLMSEANRTILDRYTIGHLYGYVFYWTDWEVVSNSFVIMAHVGFYFATAEDAISGYQYSYSPVHTTWVTPSALIENSGVDLSYMAVFIDASSPPMGIKFDNGILAGLVQIGGSNYGTISFNNMSFYTWGSWGSGGKLLTLNPSMDSIHQSTPIITKMGPGLLQVSNSTFTSWDYDADTTQVPAIDILMGSATIVGSTFIQNMMPVSNPTTHGVLHVRTQGAAEANVAACLSLDKTFTTSGSNISKTGNQAVSTTLDHYPPQPPAP